MKILIKYFKVKEIHLLLVGIVWLGISTPWMHGAISFPMIIFFGSPLNPQVRFIIAVVFIPIIEVLWLKVFTDLLYKKRQKLILTIYTLIAVVFEFIFFILLFTDPILIGEFIGPFQVRWSYFIRFSMLFFLITALITGILFARESLKSENPEIKLKGKFLLLAFIFYVTGSLLDALSFLSAIIVVVVRLILVLSAIEFYCGFILPNSIKNLFLKEK